MATHWQQSQLYRTLSAWIFISLSGLSASQPALASEQPTPEQRQESVGDTQSTLQPVPTSDYTPLKGATFYLLSDSSYGSNDEALVRLEASAQERYYIEQFGGAEVRLYRIADPLDFLKKQKNIRRVMVEANYRGEGIANTLNYLWDSWYKSSRRSWQRLLSADSRETATTLAPEFSTSKNINLPTRYENPNPFGPIPGLPLVTQFRYPIWEAKSIEPPKTTMLEGSSSDFLTPRPGNVMIPLGKQKPGLYLVEAVIGSHRATTLLFVSNSIIVTKNAGKQLLAWSVKRQDGTPMPGSKVVWSDGTGTLQSASSDDNGVALLEHRSPEHSYLFALDSEGGLAIAENFYYDSEIYNTKLYAVTDRPLYRPGDTVNLKFIARNFLNARDSQAVADGKLNLEIFDPSGMSMLQQQTLWKATQGADTAFTLPTNAQPGGYEVRMSLGSDHYSAAFRVAEYVKPHFDIQLQFATDSHKTGEAIKGQIQLRYPNGDPVRKAAISLSLRAQQLNMVEGELRYAGEFPVKLDQQELTSDENGNATLELPAAKEPSRYIVTLLANDSAAWRVKSTREILVERGMTPYRLSANTQFSLAGENVTFSWQTDNQVVDPSSAPSHYEMIRLEDRSRQQGDLANGSNSLDLALTQPGSYTLMLRDAAGNLLAATNHWVAGEGMKAAPGVIEVHFEHPRYQTGETATALVTFPEPVTEALLTLERDNIEQHALLTKGASWLTAKRLTPTQWQVNIPVDKSYSPNITFSVLSASNGDYQFRNAGLLVTQPKVDLDISSDKTSYRPGDQVRLTFSSQVGNKPAPALLTVSVVDEMVYLLQPELAPNIHDFFYHPRRNSVRTTSSLNFITYDMSLPYQNGSGNSDAHRYNERGVKVLERPRREDKDTALWQPNLQTGPDGKVRLSFIMPDSLTRWRVTARAITPDGVVGQKQSYLYSDKPFYLKWSGPTHFRVGDEPQAELIAFNSGQKPTKGHIHFSGLGAQQEQTLTINQGVNNVQVPLKNLRSGQLTSQLKVGPEIVDSLQTSIQVTSLAWPTEQLRRVAIRQNSTPLHLPADASHLRFTFASSGDAALRGMIDDLIQLPHGSVEQTASRMIPLAIAYRLADDPTVQNQLRSELLNSRLRLINLANINGSFGWWGNQAEGSLLLSSYAYYADWFATRAIDANLPAGQGEALLNIYQQLATKEPALYRLLALWWMDQMGLPIDTLLSGADSALQKEIAQHLPTPVASALTPAATPDASQAVAASQTVAVSNTGQTTTESNPTTMMGGQPTPETEDESEPVTSWRQDGFIMAAPDSDEGFGLALLLSQQLHQKRGSAIPTKLNAMMAGWQSWLKQTPDPLLQSLQLKNGKSSVVDQATLEHLLAQVTPQSPTLERALLLSILQPQLTDTTSSEATLMPLGAWKQSRQPSGEPQWQWQGSDLPRQLQFAGNLPAGTQLLLRYQSGAADPSKETLPVALTRKLYRLEPQKDQESQFMAIAVAPAEVLHSNVLYVDELTLTPQQPTHSYHFGLLEVALPPGASVEPSTWGIKVAGLDEQKEAIDFVRAQFEEGSLAYRMPIPELKNAVTVRQLVRFAARGNFTLPASRYYQVYQPTAKALTDDGRPNRWQVE